MGNSTCKNIENCIMTLVRPKSPNYENVTIEILNDDCLLQIFKHLSIEDRIKIEQVSRRWKLLSQTSWSSFKFLDFHPTTWGQTLKKKNQLTKSTLEKSLRLFGKYITAVNFNLLLKSEAIFTIFKNCPNITELLLLRVGIMDRSTFEIFMELLLTISHNIRKFGLSIDSIYYTDEELAKIFTKMVNLKLIYLERITDLHRGTFLLYLPSGIEEIYFRNISEFKNVETLKLMISKAKNLRTLGFSETRYLNFDFLLDVLKLKAKSLTKLIIRNSKWKPFHPNMLLSNMSELINLETLDVKDSSFVDDDFLDVVANNCKKLKDLRIGKCNYVTDEGITRITKLEKLNCLIMNRLSSIVSPEFKNLENIKILDCSFSKELQEDSIISLIHTANDLEILNVLGCPNISEKFVEEVFIALRRRKRGKTLVIFMKNTKNNCKNLVKYSNLRKKPFILDTISFF